MKIQYHTTLLLLFVATFSRAQSQPINEEMFVPIGGVEQWITISGEDSTKPVILFVHGGPGSTASQYKGVAFDQLKRDFVLVHWDQRGAGRTYGRNAPKELTMDYILDKPLTVERMANDGVELSKYLLKHLGKNKLILMGSSWGSILGSEIVLKAPELFLAYIGHAQFVNFPKNIEDAYGQVYQMAQAVNDTIGTGKLESLGKLPYDTAKKYGQLLRVIKRYERQAETPAPETWFQLLPGYDNEKDRQDRFNGDDYSFIHFVGHKKLNIPSMVANIDFSQKALKFEVPVYLVQGEQDILTSATINKPYFDNISAPKKEYHLLKTAAHGFNEAVVDKLHKIALSCIPVK